jgi:hypothetical protein
VDPVAEPLLLRKSGSAGNLTIVYTLRITGILDIPNRPKFNILVFSSIKNFGRWTKPLPFLPSTSSIVLTRLSGPRSRPIASRKIW